MDRRYQILHLEDNVRDATLMKDLLVAGDLHCDIILAVSEMQFEQALQNPSFDIIICDYNITAYHGLSALRFARERFSHIPVIILSGSINPEEAVECLKEGATDYILKERMERLPSAIHRAISAEYENKMKLEREAYLLESNERTRLIIENALDAVVTMDRFGLMTGWNKQAENIFGWTANEVIGQKISQIIIPHRMRNAHEIGLSRMMATGKSDVLNKRLEMPAIKRNGEEITVELTITSFINRGIRYFSAFLRDLSEQKKTDAALRESESRFNLMASSIEEVFWLYDLDSNEWEYVSSAYEKIWSKSLVALKSNPQEFLDGVHVNDRAKMRNLLSEGAKMASSGEFRLLPSNEQPQSLRWIAVQAYPVLDSSGKKNRVAGCARDITENKAMMQQINRTQRLESIGQLAGGIAHDLNNALAPVMMANELLRAEYPRGVKYLDIIESCTKRSGEMVRQLLTFAKGTETKKAPLELTKLLKEIKLTVDNTFPKHINFISSYTQKLGLVLGDFTQLHQVLLNLCVNARDAMPNGGTLTLEAKNIELDKAFAARNAEAKVGSYVVINIKDTGTGIPEDIIDRIFDPFFSTKEPDKGTGLGLSSVLGIARGHGGFINVESSIGIGSTFSVYIPRSDLDVIHNESPLISTPVFQGNGQLVLVVDDEPAIRTIAKVVLEDMNFKVITANDGSGALMAVSAHRADLRLVITDLHMPNLDGIGLIRVLKKTLPDVEVIVSSGRFDEDSTDDFKKLGIKYLINKPFSKNSLQVLLKKIFPSENY